LSLIMYIFLHLLNSRSYWPVYPHSVTNAIEP
jgi:hypothetical protein